MHTDTATRVVIVANPEGLHARVATGLADRVASACLRPGVEVVRVTVHKPQAPVAVPFDDISVTVTRRP